MSTHHHGAHMGGGGRCPVHLTGGPQHAGHVEAARVGRGQHHSDGDGRCGRGGQDTGGDRHQRYLQLGALLHRGRRQQAMGGHQVLLGLVYILVIELSEEGVPYS